MNWRVPVGFIVSPIIPCAVTVFPGIIARPEWTGGWRLIVLMVVVSQLISLVFAVPAYFLLRRYWRIGILQCLLSGAIIGAVVVAFALLVPMGSGNYSAGDSGGPTIINGQYTAHGWVVNALSAGYTGLLGASIGFFFWLVAIWSRKASRGEP